MVSALFFRHELVCIHIRVLGTLCAELLGGQELTSPRGGAQAVMSRRDAGLFLHAMYLFPALYVPPFKKQALSEPPVAHHSGCCVHPAPALAEQCPLPLPRLAVLLGHWDPSHVRDHAAAMQGPNTSPLSSYPQGRGPALCWGFSHPSCCRKPADQSGNGEGDYSSVNQAGN